MHGLIFEWDAAKDRANQRKHGVSFEEAQYVFWDNDALLIFDPEHSQDEDRFLMLGMSRSVRLLVVCHCYRVGNSVRIISARKASKQEASQYWSKI